MAKFTVRAPNIRVAYERARFFAKGRGLTVKKVKKSRITRLDRILGDVYEVTARKRRKPGPR